MINRNLLLGFGAGLIFAAGFMAVFPPSGASPSGYSKEQLQEAAKAYDMVLVSKAEWDKTKKGEEEKKVAPGPTAPVKPTTPSVKQPETGTVKKPANPQSSPGTAPAKPSPTTGTKPTSPTSPKSPTDGGEPTAPSVKQPTISLTVTAGMTSSTVAQLLVQKGVLPKDNQFVEKLRAQNKLDRIRTGTYQFPKDIQVDKLIRQLTTPPPK